MKDRVIYQPFGIPHYVWVAGQEKPISLKDIPEGDLDQLCYDWRTAVFAFAGKVPRE